MSIVLANLSASGDEQTESCIEYNRNPMDVFNITLKRRPLGFTLSSGTGKTAAYVIKTDAKWRSSLPVNSKVLKINERHVEMFQFNSITDKIVKADLPLTLTFCHPEGLRGDEFPAHVIGSAVTDKEIESVITRERDPKHMFMIILRQRPFGFVLTPAIGGTQAYVTKKAIRWANLPLNSKLLKVNERVVEMLPINDINSLVDNTVLPLNLTFCEPDGLQKDEFADPDIPPPPGNIFQVQKQSSSPQGDCKWYRCLLLLCLFCPR